MTTFPLNVHMLTKYFYVVFVVVVFSVGASWFLDCLCCEGKRCKSTGTSSRFPLSLEVVCSGICLVLAQSPLESGRPLSSSRVWWQEITTTCIDIPENIFLQRDLASDVFTALAFLIVKSVTLLHFSDTTFHADSNNSFRFRQFPKLTLISLPKVFVYIQFRRLKFQHQLTAQSE